MSPVIAWGRKLRIDSEMRTKCGIKEAKHWQEQEKKNRRKGDCQEARPGPLFQGGLMFSLFFRCRGCRRRHIDESGRFHWTIMHLPVSPIFHAGRSILNTVSAPFGFSLAAVGTPILQLQRLLTVVISQTLLFTKTCS